MGIASLKELYLDELGDLYDAETQMIRALARFAESARAPELRESLARHGEESRLHLERLQLIFTHWGKSVAPHACAGVAGIVQEADDRVNEATTPDVRDAAIIGAAQRIEHYEIAAYGCAQTYARRLNRDDEARLLQETLDEEGRADHRLTEIAEAHVNDDARSEIEEPAAATSALRYVPADQLDYRRLSGDGHLYVNNDAGDDLGVFDGLVVDDAARPRYIVVHARGVFGGRRYLLPVGHVRYDESEQVLRVDLDKGVADRYPQFDREAFAAMGDTERRGYERRVLAFFPTISSSPDRRVERPLSDVAPEWLLTGVWLTEPGDRVERLPDEARSYVNEFTPNASTPTRERKAR
jgi:ferritin-like metal-binding protein YciE